MFSSRSAHPVSASRPSDASEAIGVPVNLSGRLMLPGHDEYDCTATEMTVDTATFSCFARARRDDRIVAYLQHLGRIEGQVLSFTPDGFTISLVTTERKREKLAAQLEWIGKRQEMGLPEDRRHDRLTPRHTLAELYLEDGDIMPCRIIDLSLSGAAVEMELRPAKGTNVRLGNMNGRVVRHFMEGVAIEFDSIQSRDALIEFL